jgi:hypothetical protein
MAVEDINAILALLILLNQALHRLVWQPSIVRQ